MNCIILHGCPSNNEEAINHKTRTYDKHWIPWIKNKLESVGIEVSTPLMPEPWNPNYESWKKEFNKLKIDEETILIGHSCGSSFLVRYLGDVNKKIIKLILVAPWKISEDNNEIKMKFYNQKNNGPPHLKRCGL